MILTIVRWYLPYRDLRLSFQISRSQTIVRWYLPSRDSRLRFNFSRDSNIVQSVYKSNVRERCLTARLILGVRGNLEPVAVADTEHGVSVEPSTARAIRANACLDRGRERIARLATIRVPG